MQRKWWLVHGNFADRRQGQRRLEGDEPTRTVTKHEVRPRFGKQCVDILTFCCDGILLARRPTQATPSPIGHVDGKRIRKCPRQTHVMLRGLHPAMQEDQAGATTDSQSSCQPS